MMRSKGIAQILAVAVGLCIASSSQAATVLDGTTGGGAFFRIVVPDATDPVPWNGDLVIWNHGFSLAPPGPVTDLGPLADLQIGVEGYAIAASSYQQFGWALFKTTTDMQQLYNVFVNNFGVPNQVYLTGASLGAIVTAQLLEKGGVGNVVGALPVCGALAGGRNWDAGIDLRLVYDAVCANTPSAFIEGGATGLPEPGFPTYALNPPDPINNVLFMVLRINECMGILAPPAFRTPQQLQNLGAFLFETGIPGSFIPTDMGFALFGMSDLIWNSAKLKGKRGFGNIGVTYAIPGINLTIQRVAADNGAKNRLRQNFTPKGEISGTVKIVTLHEKADGLVIVENEREYFDIIPSTQLTQGIVDNAVANHCGFTPAEGVAAWESLRAWVAGAPQPTAAGMQGLCSAVSANPLTPGPCRIEPDCSPGSGASCSVVLGDPAVFPPTAFPDGVPSMDIRVAPR